MLDAKNYSWGCLFQGGSPVGKSLQSEEYKMGGHRKNKPTLSGPDSSEHQRKNQSDSQQPAMPSKFNLRLLSAVMLAAVQLLCSSGAPFEDAPTDSPGGDSSGEGEERVEVVSLPKTSNIFSVWETVIELMKGHQKEFEEEFQGNVNYLFLNNYKRSSFPVKCPESNFTKEACLLRMVRGLHVYTVLLKHVKKEYPNSLILPEVSRIQQLMTLIKERMKNSEGVTVLTSSQEEQLLKELDNLDAFHRKMTAHSILHYLRLFLIDGKRSLCKWEMKRRRKTGTNGANFGCQRI